MRVKKIRKLHTPTTTTKESSLKSVSTKGASSTTTTTTTIGGAVYSSSKREEEERTTLDMTGWEEEFDFSDMRGLFFIQKGQFNKSGLCVTVKEGNEYDERYIGGYDPNGESTVEHYCVIDKVTFHTIYGGSSLEGALRCLEKCIVCYKNDPERYFRQVCESTNEDFYGRHYKGWGHSSDATLKRRAEEGRCWRTSKHEKRSGYAVYKTYGRFFEDVVCDAEEKALAILETQRTERIAKRKSMKCRKVRRKRG